MRPQIAPVVAANLVFRAIQHVAVQPPTQNRDKVTVDVRLNASFKGVVRLHELGLATSRAPGRDPILLACRLL